MDDARLSEALQSIQAKLDEVGLRVPLPTTDHGTSEGVGFWFVPSHFSDMSSYFQLSITFDLAFAILVWAGRLAGDRMQKKASDLKQRILAAAYKKTMAISFREMDDDLDFSLGRLSLVNMITKFVSAIMACILIHPLILHNREHV